MPQRPRPAQARLRRFENVLLEPAVKVKHTPLTATAWQVPDEPVPFAEATAQSFESFEIGGLWGRPWSTTWFHFTGQVPADWQDWTDSAGNPGRIQVEIDLGFNDAGPGFQAEAMAYRPDGTAIKGVHPRSRHVPIEPDANGKIDFYLEAAANPDVSLSTTDSTPFGDKRTAPPAPLYQLKQADISIVDTVAWELTQDLEVLAGLLKHLDQDTTRYHQIEAAIVRMIDAVDTDDVTGTLAAGRAAIAGVLAKPAAASAHTVHAIGHAHIDSAWLWPTRETVRKCGRTFAGAIELMEEDPDYVFACSSAQQYQWVKDTQPELFERIAKRVAEGRFVPVGGQWVESDVVLTGGEALARQFVAGQSFFRDEFGVECEQGWLPDSFGYTAALPQIMRQAGINWFVTQKMSWNDTNVLPHHTFNWRGLDGSQVLTHFPPMDTYNSSLSQDDLHRAEEHFGDKDTQSVSLAPYGYGDGGGGPTREMLAAGHRSADLEGSPKVVMSSPAQFIAAVREDFDDATGPVWTGEMYLELHRGIFTSQAKTKQGNRRCEHLLREAELWCATAAVLCGAEYPYAELGRMWRTLLLQQFHDTLPGSSIAWVYEVAEADYAEISRDAGALIDRAIALVAGEGSQELIVNSGPLALAGARPMAISAADDAGSGAASCVREGDGWVLDNGAVRVIVGENGEILHLVDRESGRDAVAPGASAARFEIQRDLPKDWDAWDTDLLDRRLLKPLDSEVSVSELDSDGAAVGLVVRHSFGSSTITETITLAPGADSVEVALDVDWQERHKLLKWSNDFDVHAAVHTAETQFGHVSRALNTNTTWDEARFESCMHRWVHVGEPGYGVAIANDSTYGYDAVSSVRGDGGTTSSVRVSLLRAPTYPDPQADRGQHSMRFSIVPGAGIAEAVAAGYRMNLPARTVRGARAVDSLVSVDSDSVVVEAVKLAEDQSGDVIVRMYESQGRRGSVRLAAGFEVASAEVTDLLERGWIRPGADGSSLEVVDGGVEFSVRPFEIVTVRLTRA